MSSETNPATDGSGFHQTHVTHLVFGLLIATILALSAAVEYAGVDAHNLRFLIPLPFILAGAGGLAGLALNTRRRPS